MRRALDLTTVVAKLQITKDLAETAAEFINRHDELAKKAVHEAIDVIDDVLNNIVQG